MIEVVLHGAAIGGVIGLTGGAATAYITALLKKSRASTNIVGALFKK